MGLFRRVLHAKGDLIFWRWSKRYEGYV